MIGVSVRAVDMAATEEFFELFKTPWEPALRGRRYRVILSTHDDIGDLDAELFLIYSSHEQASDSDAGITVEHLHSGVAIEWAGWTLPIYGGVASFGLACPGSVLKANGKSVDYIARSGNRLVRRIGYDLFREVHRLLIHGQPPSEALTPTLDLHIALLRHLLIDSNISFIEIPPHPHGRHFICCLTHDVDFFGIRRHKLDRTLVGFVLRASVGTLADVARGRRSLAEAPRNWLSLCSLPLVFLRLLPDLWRPFEDYGRADRGRPSTFFLVPFKKRPGVAPDGAVHPSRAVAYGMADVRDDIRRAVHRGTELGVHGIEAWRDADAGRAEMAELISQTGAKTSGIRMHWLYFGPDSPQRLEAAGFDYDSTCGYNEAIGYRAGTSQVFRPIGAERLMELPLSIMDSALLFPGRMGLTRESAWRLCQQLIANARSFGGTLVINWHDRSLAPERLWGRLYEQILDEVDSHERAWFATAGEAVAWFRWRRSVRFRVVKQCSSSVAVEVSAPCTGSPAATIRIHRPGVLRPEVDDKILNGNTPVEVNLEMPRGQRSRFAHEACRLTS